MSLWELVIGVLPPMKSRVDEKRRTTANSKTEKNVYQILSDIDFVPKNAPEPNGRAILVISEDNDPLIQICTNGRNPTLRHVHRVHPSEC